MSLFLSLLVEHDRHVECLIVENAEYIAGKMTLVREDKCKLRETAFTSTR